MKTSRSRNLAACLFAALLGAGAGSAGAQATGVDAPECLVPAKAGGGFDFTCRLFRDMLEQARLSPAPVRIGYLPGGIGAVAYDRAVSQKLADPNRVTAFSSGSLLNIVQGKFGPHDENAVRWLAAIGTDYGVLAVRRDSPIRSLADLLEALRGDPARIAFGAGGTVGSQDWIKAALLVRAAGRDFRAMRFVSFEGGGEALAALNGGHVQVFCGDASEIRETLQSPAGAQLRIVAVLSAQRLPGYLAGVPTAREQGLDLVWPTVRGVYLGPGVSEARARQWTSTMDRALADPGVENLRVRAGLFSMALTGVPLQAFIHTEATRLRTLAASLGLRVRTGS